MAARLAHNQKVGGSNPSSATRFTKIVVIPFEQRLFGQRFDSALVHQQGVKRLRLFQGNGGTPCCVKIPLNEPAQIGQRLVDGPALVSTGRDSKEGDTSGV